MPRKASFMTIMPSSIEQLVLFDLSQVPSRLLNIFGPIACLIVLSGIELSVFDTLDAGPLAAGELARRVGADEHRIAVLLHTLAALGYVTQAGSDYCNSAITAKWLVGRSPSAIAGGFDDWHRLAEC
jgi:hypothetical protein